MSGPCHLSHQGSPCNIIRQRGVITVVVLLEACLSLCPCQTVLFCTFFVFTLNVIFITAFVFIIKKCLFIQLPILDYVSLDDRGHASFGVCIPHLCELGAQREEGPAAGQKAGEMNIGFTQRPHRGAAPVPTRPLVNPQPLSPLTSLHLHGILQARILEWVAISVSRGSSQPRNRTQVSCIAGKFFYQLSHQGSQKEQ